MVLINLILWIIIFHFFQLESFTTFYFTNWKSKLKSFIYDPSPHQTLQALMSLLSTNSWRLSRTRIRSFETTHVRRDHFPAVSEHLSSFWYQPRGGTTTWGLLVHSEPVAESLQKWWPANLFSVKMLETVRVTWEDRRGYI